GAGRGRATAPRGRDGDDVPGTRRPRARPRRPSRARGARPRLGPRAARSPADGCRGPRARGRRPLIGMRRATAVALTFASGALYGLAFPPVGWWPLAWVALVPFLIALDGSGPGRGVALGAVLGIAVAYGVGTWMPDAVIN